MSDASSGQQFTEVEMRYARTTCPRCQAPVVLLRVSEGAPPMRLDWFTVHAHEGGGAQYEHDCEEHQAERAGGST